MTIARNDPPWATFATCVLSHFAIAPAVLLLMRRNWLYEVIISVFSISCSFMYHSCQAFGVSLFLTELQWHRLDNIGAISSFAMIFTYLSAIEDPRLDFYVKFSGLLIGIIAQEHSPWDVTYTVAPIAMYIALPVIFYFLLNFKCSNAGRAGGGKVLGGRWNPVADFLYLYELKSIVLGFGGMACAIPFFLAGLNDAEDPYRIFHGMWNLIGGLSAYYMWRVVKNPMGTNMQAVMCEEGRAPRLN